MNNQDNITISKYINGELTGAELAEFEKLLSQDKALNDEVNFHKVVDETLSKNYQAIKSIDESERLEFEGILSKVMGGEIINKPEVPSSGLIRRLWPLAALAAAAAVLFFMISSPNLSSVTDQYYFPYQYNPDPILGPNEGIKAYENKDYQTALDFFNNNPSGDLKQQFAKGNAEYNLEKYDDAIRSFDEIKEKTGNPSFKNYANWYLALTHLKKKDKKLAIKRLKELPKDADFHTQAQELLKKLE